MSQVVRHGDTIYLAGQVTQIATVDAAEQTKNILNQIEDLLDAQGSGKSHILSASIWLSDMEYFDAFNQVWDN